MKHFKWLTHVKISQWFLRIANESKILSVSWNLIHLANLAHKIDEIFKVHMDFIVFHVACEINLLWTLQISLIFLILWVHLVDQVSQLKVVSKRHVCVLVRIHTQKQIKISLGCCIKLDDGCAREWMSLVTHGGCVLQLSDKPWIPVLKVNKQDTKC